jgi:hypothetical protein
VGVGNATIVEGHTGTRRVLLTVSLTTPATETVEVDFRTEPGTATKDEDFTGTRGSLSFAPGEVTKSIAVEIRSDLVAEPDERLRVVLLNPSAGVGFVDRYGAIFILDDD